jgi:capsular polysaccharide biosynthesis protein
MGNFGFLTGIGAAQKAQKAAAKSTDGKSTVRRHPTIEIVVGILLALFIAAGLLFLLATAYQV